MLSSLRGTPIEWAGGEQICVSTDLALKSAGITDFCYKLNGLADFENTAEHGSAVDLLILKVRLRILS